MEYWSVGVSEYWSENPVTPLLHYSISRALRLTPNALPSPAPLPLAAALNFHGGLRNSPLLPSLAKRSPAQYRA